MSVTTTDPIADMLTRVRNAMAVDKDSVMVPYSKIKAGIADILSQHGFVGKVKVEGDGTLKALHIKLEGAKITQISRVSKPGRRIYTASKDIPTVLSGRGIVIVSTPSGLMTGNEARKLGLGGELICKVW